MLKMDGYDDCIVGIIDRCGQEPIICYDREKVIQKLMDNDGMDRDEAIEYFEFNQAGAWLGDGTPCFLTHMTADEIDELADTNEG